MDTFPPGLYFNIIFILIIAFLRLSQVSVENVSEAHLTKLAEDGNKKAKKGLVRLEKQARIYYCFKIVIIFCELLVASVNTIFVNNIIIEKNLVNHQMLYIVLAVLLITVFIQLFAIYLPQKIATEHPEKVLFNSFWLIDLVYYVFMPLEFILSGLSTLMLKPFGVNNNGREDEDVTEEEIRYMVDVGSELGAIDQDEKEMIHNIFELDDTAVKDIMTHRTDVVVLWAEDSADSWEETMAQENHSVYPVCRESVDDILGFVKSNDFYKLLRNTKNGEEPDVSSIIKSAFLVPETVKADDLFRQMQIAKNHFAIVIDEYGGFSGIITMSDLLEEIVGDLDNNTDNNDEEEITKIDSNTWKILGSTEIETVSKALDIELPIEEYNTFAGMILGELGAIPDNETDAEVEAFGLQIKVTKVIEHRIEETIVCKTEQQN